MRYQLIIFFLLGLLIATSCSQDYILDVPEFDNDIVENTNSLDSVSKFAINGIYKVTDRSNKFGDSVVFRWNKDYLSVFCGKNAAYMILQGGETHGKIVFQGYWRFAAGDDTGLIYLEIGTEDGAEKILEGQKTDSIFIKGYFGNETINQQREINLRFVAPLKEFDDFFIIAHRGGGRNADKLPFSENSLEILDFAGRLGANAIEIDVQLTKDKIPVLYHDKNLNTRLINGEFMIGPVSNYYLYQLTSFCTLKHGETIPTLDKALEKVLNLNEILFVWLDIKSVDAIPHVVDIIEKYDELSKRMGRDLSIMVGIPNSEIYNLFDKEEELKHIPTICELDLEKALNIKAEVWAPRWTLGLQQDNVEKIHSAGSKALVWTVDNHDFMKKVIHESNFNGMVTNFPTLAAYEYYVRNKN